jgi:hypothetical protein
MANIKCGTKAGLQLNPNLTLDDNTVEIEYKIWCTQEEQRKAEEAKHYPDVIEEYHPVKDFMESIMTGFFFFLYLIGLTVFIAPAITFLTICMITLTGH